MAIYRGSGSSLTGSAVDPTNSIQDTDFGANGLMVRTAAGVYSTTPDNTSNWDTAYTWGDWSVGVDKTFVDNLNVDADTLDGQQGTWYLDRTNHTGTQLLSTISDSGTAAAADLTTSATDTTAGRAMATGLGGLGTIPPATVADFNAHLEPGFWRTANNSQAEMPFAGNFSVLQFNFDSNSQMQIAVRADGVGPQIRNKVGGTWGSWYRDYKQDNILGTVSQSSGVPTGAIIEQGSNSNGEYTKFADGTMVCRLVDFGLNQQTSSRLRNTWTFPAAFSSTPAGHATVSDSAAPFPVENITGSRIPTTTTTSMTVDVYDSGSTLTGGEMLLVDVTATGRWF